MTLAELVGFKKAPKGYDAFKDEKPRQSRRQAEFESRVAKLVAEAHAWLQGQGRTLKALKMPGDTGTAIQFNGDLRRALRNLEKAAALRSKLLSMPGQFDELKKGVELEVRQAIQDKTTVQAAAARNATGFLLSAVEASGTLEVVASLGIVVKAAAQQKLMQIRAMMAGVDVRYPIFNKDFAVEPPEQLELPESCEDALHHLANYIDGLPKPSLPGAADGTDTSAPTTTHAGSSGAGSDASGLRGAEGAGSSASGSSDKPKRSPAQAARDLRQKLDGVPGASTADKLHILLIGGGADIKYVSDALEDCMAPSFLAVDKYAAQFGGWRLAEKASKSSTPLLHAAACFHTGLKMVYTRAMHYLRTFYRYLDAERLPPNTPAAAAQYFADAKLSMASYCSVLMAAAERLEMQGELEVAAHATEAALQHEIGLRRLEAAQAAAQAQQAAQEQRNTNNLATATALLGNKQDETTASVSALQEDLRALRAEMAQRDAAQAQRDAALAAWLEQVAVALQQKGAAAAGGEGHPAAPRSVDQPGPCSPLTALALAAAQVEGSEDDGEGAAGGEDDQDEVWGLVCSEEEDSQGGGVAAPCELPVMQGNPMFNMPLSPLPAYNVPAYNVPAAK